MSAAPEALAKANIVTMHLLERMNFTSTDFPSEEDEFDWAGLTAVPAAKVWPFRVAEAKAHLECEVAQIVTDRNTNIVLGRIIHAHVDPSVWKNGRVDPQLLDPVCRLSGSGYAALGALVNVQRPQWKNIEGTIGLRIPPLPSADWPQDHKIVVRVFMINAPDRLPHSARQTVAEQRRFSEFALSFECVAAQPLHLGIERQRA